MQFSHLCMCDKVNFSLYIIPCVKGFRRVSVDCLFYTFRQGGYLHTYIYMTVAPVDIYICMWICCVCVCAFLFSCSLTSNMSKFVFVFYFQMKLLVQHQRL